MMTAGKLVVKGGSFHLNKLVLQQAEKRNADINKKIPELRKCDELKYLIDCHKANEAYERNKTYNAKKWRSASKIQDFLRPLRLKSDSTMPLKRNDLECHFFNGVVANECKLCIQKTHMKNMKFGLRTRRQRRNLLLREGGNKNKSIAATSKRIEDKLELVS